ncbi:conserved membrane hypothetical protein [Nostocoides japonicum T1-X7]|uniref:ResB-like domain-containing protein n=1 Tax=Nostocoides japonicum T1-X7 TaxID=1194083 RepID=A0A077LUC6_9MICO|nr:cytochrome c biogenesis protein ResB [Tetrasphaera japonica]CCH77106.1 conserved membrane hypothetical protein [Tetrasphaera japonica T1-X7]
MARDLPRKDRTIVQPRLGPVGWLRFLWRQLTSMRTALLLLLALAVAALPGSVLPQRSIDATRTTAWLEEHSTIGPVLDRFGFFSVYASPWFAAIYLLLFVSLVGCVLPRSRQHWRAMRAAPPRTPKRLERLPAHATATVESDPETVLAALRSTLRRRRYRVHAYDESSLSAEGGYLKETGNLVFHLALLGVIVGVAIGHIWGWKGDVILPQGQTFANTLIRYDTFSPGPWVDPDDLRPFTLTLDRMEARFEETTKGSGQFGTPRDFTAYVKIADQPGETPRPATIKVNQPLSVPGGTAFLLGNGYAPVVTVKDAKGEVLYHDATPFLAQDNNYKSVGAIKVPAASPKELGFTGFFLPTASLSDSEGPVSLFPDALKPALVLTAYEGTLAPGGRPQSVYTLDTSELTQLKKPGTTQPLTIWLEPGQTYTLPGGRGTITFDSVERFAGISIRHDPGKWLTLGSALLMVAGLLASLLVRRRRVFVRVSPVEAGGSTLVTVGGLAKDDDEGMPDVLQSVLDSLTAAPGERR